jgi:hypothetical protein
MLKLADAAIVRRIPTAIVLPTGGTAVAAVIAAAVLVRHTAEVGTPTAKVALVSRQLTLRPFYRALCIRDLNLSDFYRFQRMDGCVSGGVAGPHDPGRSIRRCLGRASHARTPVGGR